MLADPHFFTDDTPRFQHRAVGWALLLSLLLHALLVLYLDVNLEWGGRDAPAATSFSTLELRVRAPSAVDPRPSVEPVAAPATTTLAPVTEVEPVPPQTETPEQSLPKTLRPGLILDLQDVLPDTPEPGAPETITDNGATVMNSELFTLLQDAERRSGYVPGAEGGHAVEFQGGAWVDFVRDGDRCFRVVRADPLEPGSHDMWYRVSCR